MRGRGTTVALGLAAAAAAAAAIVVTFVGRSPESKPHRQVADYVQEVNAVHAGMTRPLALVLATYRSFTSAKRSDPAVEQRLADAERTLRTLERRVAAIPAPAPAAPVRTLLLRLIRLDVRIAGEVRLLARFTPAFQAALAQSNSAGARLSHDLAAVKPPDAHVVHGTAEQVARAQAEYDARASAAAAQQAAAVERYDAVLVRVLGSLRKLHPPPALAPAWHAQLTALTGTRAAGAALARELRGKDRTQVARLDRSFILATRSAGSVAAQKAQIAAVKAYNARVRSTQTLQLRLQSELTRLAASLG